VQPQNFRRLPLVNVVFHCIANSWPKALARENLLPFRVSVDV
jgi:hypothetical protein